MCDDMNDIQMTAVSAVIIIYFKVAFISLFHLEDYPPVVFSVIQHFFIYLVGNS